VSRQDDTNCEPSVDLQAELPVQKVFLDLSLCFLVLFIVARLMVSGMSQETTMPSINKLIELAGIVALACWLLSMLTSRRVHFLRTGLLLPVLALTALAVLSAVHASYTFGAASTAFTWIVHSLLFLLVVNLGSSARRFNVILAGLLATTVVICALAFYQYFYEFPQVQAFFEQNPDAVLVHENLRGELAGRVYLNEVFATFLLSNTFGGFLIMVAPVLGFLALRAARSTPPNCTAAVLIPGCTLAAGALYLCGSKGAWLALLAGGILFLCLAQKKVPLRYILAAACAAVILMVLAMSVAGFSRLPASAQVRLGYWDAALRMVAARPAGVGISNFQEHYCAYQQPWATEVKNPHNSYLSIWSELSVAGVAAFLSVLLISGRHALRALRVSPAPRREDSRTGASMGAWPLLAGAAGFAFVVLMAGIADIPFTQPPWVAAAAAVLWTLVAAGLLRHGFPDGTHAPAGIALGLLAFACHAFIDFDFYSHGINAVFWTMLGMLVSYSCRAAGATTMRLRLKGAAILLPAAGLACAFVYGALCLPPMLEADWAARNASLLAEDAVRARYEPTLALGAAREFEKAQGQNPLNADNYARAAELYDNLYFKTGDPAHAAKAVENYSRLLEVRSASHWAHLRLGILTWFACKDSGAPSKVLSHFEKAVSQYPINAGYHYQLAVYLEAMAAAAAPGEAAGLRARAGEEFRRALRLHEEVVFPRGRLSPEQLARAADAVRPPR
jgi:hypothetical protein